MNNTFNYLILKKYFSSTKTDSSVVFGNHFDKRFKKNYCRIQALSLNYQFFLPLPSLPGETKDEALYVIKHNDEVCMLATMNTTIRISYEATGEFNQVSIMTY